MSYIISIIYYIMYFRLRSFYIVNRTIQQYDYNLVLTLYYKNHSISEPTYYAIKYKAFSIFPSFSIVCLYINFLIPQSKTRRRCRAQLAKLAILRFDSCPSSGGGQPTPSSKGQVSKKRAQSKSYLNTSRTAKSPTIQNTERKCMKSTSRFSPNTRSGSSWLIWRVGTSSKNMITLLTWTIRPSTRRRGSTQTRNQRRHWCPSGVQK